jgi:putative endonuclease
MQSYVHQYFTYIVTNEFNTVLYVGVTNDLQKRMWEHKKKTFPGFTAKYNCNRLVYFEEFNWIQDAIDREKQLKAGSRQNKIDLIILTNSTWNDLSEDWYE